MARFETLAGGILLPDGSIFDPQPVQEVIPISDLQEKRMFAGFDQVAQRYGLAVVCQKCNYSLEGHNNGTTPTLSVACKCREWRFVGTGAKPIMQ